jgi:membrane-bound lytic murein transglycosylase B
MSRHVPSARVLSNRPKPAFPLSLKFAVAGVCVALLAAACESDKLAGGPSPSKPPPVTPPPASGGQTPAPITFKSSGDASFDKWRTAFAAKAQGAGRKKSSITAVLDGLTPLEENLQVAAFEQAEFVKPIWDYAKSAVSPTRIANGQKKMADNKTTFDKIEQTYATPREIVTAVWGMESSYGSYIGDIDAPRALATQAAQGRRQAFNEGELMAVMQIIENGSATRDQFKKGSWAGAIGQVQFMPSTYLQHARDFDMDGKKDVWTDAGDALASAANYLTVSGWRKGEPWAVETKIPNGFDFSLGDGRKLPVSQWKALGLQPATRDNFADSDSLQAELFLPAGSYGPAFLLFDNFGVIKKYNNADSYALAIGLLADALAGRPGLARPWPTNITLLTQTQVKDMQTALNKLGYNAGTADGLIGRNTRGALQKFQKDRALIADGFPTTEMLEKVIAAAA